MKTRLSMFHAARLSVSPLFLLWPIAERNASIYCFPTHDYKAVSCFKQILAVYLNIRGWFRYRGGITRQNVFVGPKNEDE